MIDDNEEKSFTRVIYGESSQYKINDKVKFYRHMFAIFQNFHLVVPLDLLPAVLHRSLQITFT